MKFIVNTLVSHQVCGCCARTPRNACFPSFAPRTTTYPESMAWWKGCARLSASHCASWMKRITMIFLHFLLLQVCLFLAVYCAVFFYCYISFRMSVAQAVQLFEGSIHSDYVFFTAPKYLNSTICFSPHLLLHLSKFLCLALF